MSDECGVKRTAKSCGPDVQQFFPDPRDEKTHCKSNLMPISLIRKDPPFFNQAPIGPSFT